MKNLYDVAIEEVDGPTLVEFRQLPARSAWDASGIAFAEATLSGLIHGEAPGSPQRVRASVTELEAPEFERPRKWRSRQGGSR